jgi:hypothetical protein
VLPVLPPGPPLGAVLLIGLLSPPTPVLLPPLPPPPLLLLVDPVASPLLLPPPPAEEELLLLGCTKLPSPKLNPQASLHAPAAIWSWEAAKLFAHLQHAPSCSHVFGVAFGPALPAKVVVTAATIGRGVRALRRCPPWMSRNCSPQSSTLFNPNQASFTYCSGAE